jgi:hypothetical protein
MGGEPAFLFDKGLLLLTVGEVRIASEPKSTEALPRMTKKRQVWPTQEEAYLNKADDPVNTWSLSFGVSCWLVSAEQIRVPEKSLAIVKPAPAILACGGILQFPFYPAGYFGHVIGTYMAPRSGVLYLEKGQPFADMAMAIIT